MVIAVASGKGGTGKTTVAVNMSVALGNTALIDCDVEEPNAHIFLKPAITQTAVCSIPVPQIDEEQCVYCGKCAGVCAYHALAALPPQGDKEGMIMTFPDLCHGCGACAALCPRQAIKEIPRAIGVVERGTSGKVDFVAGRLNVGEAMAPPLIRDVLRYVDSSKTVIIDAPPGTSCPMVSAVKKSDYVILVTEPTPFGLNDLKLAVEVLGELAIPFGVVINRYGLGDDAVEDHCRDADIPVLMRIPFDKKIAAAYSRGEMLLDVVPGLKEEFLKILRVIESAAASGGRERR